MSRYNSQFSGSQIDGAISYVLNGYPIDNYIATESLKITGSLSVSGDITGSNLRVTSLQASGSTKMTGSFEVTGSINVLGVVNITGSMNLTGNETVFGSIYATSSLSDFYIALLNTGKPTLQLWNRNPAGVLGDAQIMLRTNNAGAIEDSFYITKGAGNEVFPMFKNNTIFTNSTGSIIFTDRNNTNRIFEIDTSNNKLNLTGSLNVSGSIEPVSGSSIVLLSPNGTRFKLIVDDSGVVSSSLV
jgi:hypothetical protein